MALTDRGRQHRRRCVHDHCGHWLEYAAEADRRGSRFFGFCAGGDAEPADPATWTNMTPEFWNGPDSNCPEGRWARAQRRPAGTPQPTKARCLYADRFQEGCCHRWQVRCAHPARTFHGPRCPAGCPDRVPPEDLKIAAVVTAWNEGEEVRKTVESLLASVEHADLDVILVDDAGTDGSCAFAAGMDRVTLVRHEESRGVGRSRNHGWEVARDGGAHVVTFHDAHMRFPAGTLEGLAVKALRSGAVTTAASHHVPSKGTLRGCWMHYNHHYCLQPKWITGRPEEPWYRVPCMMGACYALAAGTADRLERATGYLWDDVAGRWGFSEQALSVKAFLLGVPVLQSAELSAGHLYRSENPVPDAHRQTWRNRARCCAVLFGRDVFEDRFRGWCEKWLGPKEIEEIAEEAAGHELTPERAGLTPDELERRRGQVFTHLLGREGPVTEVHESHAWLPEVENACREVAARHPAGRGARLLQWRPGEATVRARGLLPRAEIHAVELPGHRADVWAGWCEGNDVKLHRAGLGDGYLRAAEAASDAAGFDLVLVGGEAQEECTALAEELLRDGGRMVVNRTADRLLIESDRLRKEREMLDGSDAGPTGGGPSATAGAPDPLVTVCLLNWRRAENIGPVLDAIGRQTVPARVLIWDNNEGADRLIFREPRTDQPKPIEQHPLVDLVVESSRNLRCWPRWLLASMAETEFVCSLDDDLAFADERVLEDAVAAQREKCPDGIVGFFGWQKVDGRGYRRSRHVNGSRRDRRVDLIKGRFMLFRCDLLRRVPLRHPVLEVAPGLRGRADDVYLNFCIGRGRPGAHLVPGVLGKRWRELDQRGASLAAQRGHYEERGRMVRAFLDFYSKKGG